MVTCTAIWSAILYPSRKRGTRQHGREAQHVVGNDVSAHQQPLALLEQSEGFKGITRESCVGAAKADSDEKAPARVEEHALAGPNEEKTEYEAAGDVDDQRAVRKAGRKNLGNVTAQKVTGAGTHNRP